MSRKSLEEESIQTRLVEKTENAFTSLKGGLSCQVSVPNALPTSPESSLGGSCPSASVTTTLTLDQAVLMDIAER